jgi:predicted ATPase
MELLERGSTLEQLNGLLSDADRGQGRLVVIGGEAGIGKTALIRHFCESVSDRADVFVGTCDPLSTPTPLGPLFEIASALGRGLDDLLRERASIGVLGATLLTWRGLRARVLVFEDIHCADEATLDLLRFLARRLTLLRYSDRFVTGP